MTRGKKKEKKASLDSSKGKKDSAAEMNASKASHTEAADPQVQQIHDDAPLPSLLNVVAEKMLGNHRDPRRPTISRLVLIGEINRDDQPRTFLEEAAIAATKRVNAQDPTGGKGSSIADPMNITGVYIELPSHFFQIVESEPAHLFEYVQELHNRWVARKTFDGVRKISVPYYVDDVIHRMMSRWGVIDAPLPPGTLPEGYQLENLVVQAVKGISTMLSGTQTYSKAQIESFLATVKTSNASAMPRTSLVEKLLSSGLCLTLDEFVQVFCKPPQVTRAAELLHPVEPPLKH